MPPEWHPHFGTWVSWPHNRDTWPKNLPEARAEFENLIRAIGESDRHVYVSLNDECMSDEFRLSLEHLSRSNWLANMILNELPTNDAWARDYAPTFVLPSNEMARSPQTLPWFPRIAGRLAAVDWHYNAWGGKYPPFDDDQKVAARICEKTGTPRIQSELTLEGGAIEVDGTGVLLTTRSCVLNPNRNPEWSIQAIETELMQKLGVDKIVWLEGPAITGDDTDGHIDQLARFVNETTIVYAWTEDSTDPQLPGLQQNLSDLKEGLNRFQLDVDLIPLPLPKNPVKFDGVQIPASYCNFYITNGAVIVPQFDDPNDDRAIEILREQFPTRAIIGLPSVNLTVGLGSFHCLTQQMPDPDGFSF